MKEGSLGSRKGPPERPHFSPHPTDRPGQGEGEQMAAVSGRERAWRPTETTLPSERKSQAKGRVQRKEKGA